MPSPTPRPHTPSWQALAARFGKGRDCLASYLALELAEVLEGAKPANLIRISGRKRPCGRNLFRLWEVFGPHLVHQAGLVARTLSRGEDFILLLIYHPETLRTLLNRANVASFLSRAGYEKPSGTETALNELQARFGLGDFPHEVGVFLGYPLKDVAGFLGWAPLPHACSRAPWRVYGDPAPSLRLADTFRRCRRRMAHRLECCTDPMACLTPPGRARGEQATPLTNPHCPRPSGELSCASR